MALCVLLVVLSGCGSASLEGPAPTTTPQTFTGTATTDVPSATTTEQDASSSTTTGTPTPKPVDNPWGREPVVIGVDGSRDPNRNYTSPVSRAVEFWETNGSNATAWPPVFRLSPDASNPDVVVRFVSTLEACGTESTELTVGCAARLDADDEPAEPEVVFVNMGLTNESTYRVVRHELGHVLGLEHGQGPGAVMKPYDRVFDRVIRVYFEHHSGVTAVRLDREEQAARAFEYYAEGADGHVTEELEFAVVEDRPGADVVIEFFDQGGRSIARSDDGPVVIEIHGILVQHTGWHVGYWLGFYFGAETLEDLPPPFDEPEHDRRSQWWH